MTYELLILLTIVLPSLAEIEMKFTKYPESVIALVGDDVTFECAVKVPAEHLFWRWQPADKPDDVWTQIEGSVDKDKTKTKVVVRVAKDNVTALYQCVVSYGSIRLASIPARLSIAKIESPTQSQARVITAPVLNTIVLHCKEPASEPPAVLTWWKEYKGTRKPLDTPQGVLVIHNTTVDDSGTYGCIATNELSGQTIDLPDRTYLRIQHEDRGEPRFLETEDYVGTKDTDEVLSVYVRPSNGLYLYCGAVGVPSPIVTWTKDGEERTRIRQGHPMKVESFMPEDEGMYSCAVGSIRRTWRVVALTEPQWPGNCPSVNASEGTSATISCGAPIGTPEPRVYWLLNGSPMKGRGISSTDSEIFIDRTEKKHAGIVQSFACNQLGCSYDAALLTVVPMQISDKEYSEEVAKSMHFTAQPPKRHNRKNSRKHKAVMVPPSRPNVTRMSDDSVMVSWSNANHGLLIQFFKVQYKEATNASNAPWHTCSLEIPPHIHAHQVDGLMPNKYYKFRIAAVYSNQDNKMGRSTGKFYLKSGVEKTPQAPRLENVESLSPHSLGVNWTWSRGNGVEAEGFYVYYRAVSSAGEYVKVTVPGGVRARYSELSHLQADTPYEVKVQSYTAQAPSYFTTIMTAKTKKPIMPETTTTPPPDVRDSTRAPGALVTAGGALGACALLAILAITLLLCRRAKRPSLNKEKGPKPENGAANGYIQAKVPITITANPMHADGADNAVEMSFLHNNNCGNANSNDDTLPHNRKNGSTTRQYV